MKLKKVSAENIHNILYIPRVREKNKWTGIDAWWFGWLYYYYKSEEITLKEKLYTFWYNMEKHGYSTRGEVEWNLSLTVIDPSTISSIRGDFNRDLIEYVENPLKYDRS